MNYAQTGESMANFKSLFCLMLMLLPSGLSAQQSEAIYYKGAKMNIAVKTAVLEARTGEDTGRLNVAFEVSSTASKPWIVIGPAIQIVGVRIADSKQSLDAGKFLVDQSHLPSFKNEALTKGLTFRSEGVQILRPGELFRRKIDYQIFMPESLRRSASKDVWFELDVSFFPMNTMPAEGLALQDAWADRGRLFLETLSTVPTKMQILRSGERR